MISCIVNDADMVRSAVAWGGLTAATALGGMVLLFAVVGFDEAGKSASMIGLTTAVAGLGGAVYGAAAARRAWRRVSLADAPAQRDSPPYVKQLTVQVTNGRGILIGDHGHQENFFHIDVPAVLWASLVTLIASVLAVGAGWLYFDWFSPRFAPNYRTQFLVDGADTADSAGITAVTTSLRKAIGNSGDHDALSLRRFGGECGTSGNTVRLAGFATGNRQKITDEAARIRAGGRATLVRGIVEAVEDFSKPLASKARQVNRIIVVTRHGADACDSDTSYVENEIRSRIRAAGLSLEFRLIGYQVPAGQRQMLDRIAAAARAPRPTYAKNADELQRTLEWHANTEPVLKSAQSIVNTLNTTVTQVNTAVKAIVDGHLDLAESTLGRARESVDDTAAQFGDLAARAKDTPARDVRDRALRLREKQRRVVAAAEALLKDAKAGAPTDPRLTVFHQAAEDYNSEVNGMNQVLASLRVSPVKKP
ncbi:VWA domain-containing protein [Actinomadura chibensis]|uniref:VWA domain-containing protein n=1 Tax=Actinomadura chibensis TaxID=392828 RepID=A0A5D0NQL0_9ACTN|nr:VWA domain-containing protein [Actinomadura chibensis]TYB46361.1 VWA domain-containing protein [Actinomadura chibensis]